jgi:hypothetical protein
MNQTELDIFSLGLARKIIAALMDYSLVHSDKTPMSTVQEKNQTMYYRLHGECDHSKKQITIFKHDCFAEKFSTVLHELLHAIYPALDEKRIEELTEACARDHLK